MPDRCDDRFGSTSRGIGRMLGAQVANAVRAASGGHTGAPGAPGYGLILNALKVMFAW